MRPGEDLLNLVLATREERVSLRLEVARRIPAGGVMVQGSLNVPGWPKLLGDDWKRLDQAISTALEGFDRLEMVRRVDPLGPFWIGWVVPSTFGEDPLSLIKLIKLIKSRCVAAEEGLPWGRLVDLDVFDPLNPMGPVKRDALGLGERRCLMCRRPAKECAVLRRHHPRALRRRALLLWRFPEHFLEIFSPDL